ncbi:hypothetical protein M3204_15570 [Mesobacillus subterraneus]|uniref:hypothetical protein n=1 Tax=Mesobacillus subterraneus TaxID=285983 RepID=UPI002041DA0B|nr:hypothetical protein [Mesobacillus subterraneus]MCM3665837.1 hypothetical protein [Mesobacillus subterraneus]MCM3684772.1 hypothetical protein [Mesobacillus subterraneus]
MKKSKFKSSFQKFLSEEVEGLSNEQKIKYMKKWIKDYQNSNESDGKPLMVEEVQAILSIDSSKKIGVLVRTTIDDIIKRGLLTPNKIVMLQDERYCKETFDINFPMLKKVDWKISLFNQRKINGYDRYWAEPVTIQNEKFLICKEWYERNKPKFIMWVKNLA